MEARRQGSLQKVPASTALNNSSKHDAGGFAFLVPDDGPRAWLALFRSGIEQLFKGQCV